MIFLLACTDPEVTLATFSGRIAWMTPEHEGWVAVDSRSEEAPWFGVLREQALAEDGSFAVELPVGEVMLDGSVTLDGAEVCDLYVGPRALGPDGLHLVWEWCGGFE